MIPSNSFLFHQFKTSRRGIFPSRLLSESLQECLRDLRRLSICPSLEASKGTKIAMINRFQALPV